MYFVVVSRHGDGANPFYLEIERRRNAMGVKVFGSGYRSYGAAYDAGSRALDQFLGHLSKKIQTSRSLGNLKKYSTATKACERDQAQPRPARIHDPSPAPR
jgi:hypothetical protein